MNKRSFLKKLLGAALVSVTPIEIAALTPVPDIRMSLMAAMSAELQAEIDREMIARMCIAANITIPSPQELVYRVIPTSTTTFEIEWLYREDLTEQQLAECHKLADANFPIATGSKSVVSPINVFDDFGVEPARCGATVRIPYDHNRLDLSRAKETIK